MQATNAGIPPAQVMVSLAVRAWHEVHTARKPATNDSMRGLSDNQPRGGFARGCSLSNEVSPGTLGWLAIGCNPSRGNMAHTHVLFRYCAKINRGCAPSVVGSHSSRDALMDRIIAALISIASVATAGMIGASYGPQRPREAAWYASLRKPPYTPPGPAIGITWGVLETLLCVVGYRLLAKPTSVARSVGLGGWLGTLAGLAGYPASFFGSKRLGASTAVAAAMLASTATTATAAEGVDRPAAIAMMPLVVWTGFAVLLSEEIWRRNQPSGRSVVRFSNGLLRNDTAGDHPVMGSTCCSDTGGG